MSGKKDGRAVHEIEHSVVGSAGTVAVHDRIPFIFRGNDVASDVDATILMSAVVGKLNGPLPSDGAAFANRHRHLVVAAYDYGVGALSGDVGVDL